MDDGRQHDLQELNRLRQTADTPLERKRIEASIDNIRHEDGAIKSMRESLIKEIRQGNTANVRDIHEYVAKKRKYQNDYNKWPK